MLSKVACAKHFVRPMAKSPSGGMHGEFQVTKGLYSLRWKFIVTHFIESGFAACEYPTGLP
jgi:hypothetical protein